MNGAQYAGLQSDIVRMASESYDRGLLDGAQTAIEGMQSLGLITPEIAAEAMRTVTGAIAKILSETGGAA